MPSVDILLGTADNFLVLGATPSVTNSGSTVLAGGGLGIYPAASVTGFPPGVVNAPFSIHLADAAASQAQTDAQTAYTYFQGLTPHTLIVGALDGQTFTPGTYYSASAILLNVGQTVTLDGGGDQNSVFVFQAGSSITLGVNSTVKLQNGANARNIVWAAGAAITVGTSAVINGNLIGTAAVTLGTSAALNGRAISLTAAVTLLGNAITVPTPAPAPGPVPPGPLPNPGGPSAKAAVVLSEVCHPDITGKTLRSWGVVAFEVGAYTTGGISMGLTTYLDVRTVDFFGFLKCGVWGEEPVGGNGLYEYHYSPVTDALQIFNANGTELTNGTALPLGVLLDLVLFEVTVDRTSVRG